MLIGFTILMISSKSTKENSREHQSLPILFKGDFEDDYGIRYNITDSVWIQYPSTKYHIISWNKKGQYILVRNDDANQAYSGLYTRIDYTRFSGMQPFAWGYCLTNYSAQSIEDAKATASADRKNPKNGCGGFPFSRMKSIKKP